MRGLEAVIGGLLVLAGVAGPVADQPGVVADRLVDGTASFANASYEGETKAISSDAVLDIAGPMEMNLSGRNVSVSVGESYEVRVDTPLRDNTATVRSGEVAGRHPKASLSVEGDIAGVVNVWPEGGDADSRFSLSLDPRKTPDISASSTRAVSVANHVYSESGYPSPAYVLTHGGRSTTYDPSPAVFESLQISGRVGLFIDNATLTVQHPGGTDTYRVGTQAREGMDDPAVQARRGTYAIVMMDATNASMRFDDVEAAFYTQRPTWSINGTLSFTAMEGHVHAAGDNRSLEDRDLRLEGNLSLRTQPQRQDTVHTADHYVDVDHSAQASPGTQAEFEGDAEEVYVDGRPIERATPTPGAKDATFAAKVLGLVLLAFSLVKKLAGFVVPLFNGDPLKNSTRREIHEYVTEQGLAYTREIKRETGKAAATVAYHLKVLEGAGLLTSVKHGGYRVYFVPSREFSGGDMERLSALADPTRREIAEAVVQGEATTQKGLAERVGLHVSNVSRQLAKLDEAGLVSGVGDWRIEYRPTQLLRAWVQRD